MLLHMIMCIQYQLLMIALVDCMCANYLWDLIKHSVGILLYISLNTVACVLDRTSLYIYVSGKAPLPVL